MPSDPGEVAQRIDNLFTPRSKTFPVRRAYLELRHAAELVIRDHTQMLALTEALNKLDEVDPL